MKAIAVSELIKNPATYIEVETLEIEERKNRYGRTTSEKFQCKQLIVEKVQSNGIDLVTINYINPEKMIKTYAVVPNEFLATILSPEKYADLEKKHKLFSLQNLYPTCSFSGRIGSDPEIFVENGKGQIIPAFNFLGSKQKPNLAPKRDHAEYKGENACYWDGFQAEFTTDHSFCMGWHVDSIQVGLEGIYLAAKAHNKRAKLSTRTVFDIPPEMMLEAQPEHVQFGCMPSLNAYNMHGLDLPGTEVPFRSAGGHIHLSFNDAQFKTKEMYVKMVKAMDVILGVACVSMFAEFDDVRRREMYGLAGEYRLPPHGLEYRVLSNAWLFHPIIANIVFDLGRTAAMFGAKDLLTHWECSEAETIRIINTCDVKAAREVLERNKELLLKILYVQYYKNFHTAAENYAKYAYKVMFQGMDTIIKDIEDIEGNWNLGDKWVSHGDGVNKNVHQVHNGKNTEKKV